MPRLEARGPSESPIRSIERGAQIGRVAGTLPAAIPTLAHPSRCDRAHGPRFDRPRRTLLPARCLAALDHRRGSIRDPDVGILEACWHGGLDPHMHIFERHCIRYGSDSAQECRIRDRTAEDIPRDGIGIQTDDARVIHVARGVEQDHPTRGELRGPLLGHERLIQVDDDIRLPDDAPIPYRAIGYLGVGAHRCPAPLRPERRESERMSIR